MNILLIVLLVLLALLLSVAAGFIVSALLVDPRREYQEDSPYYRFLVTFCAVAAMTFSRVRLRVSGVEKVPADSKLLFVSNHRSAYDPIVTWYALRRHPFAFITKEENLHIPVLGRFVRRCCFMSIDRENARKAAETVRSAVELIGKGELAVGVYPEGTRSKSGELLPFHNMVFKIAQRANAAIVVLTVDGTEKIRRNAPFRATEVKVSVLEVLPYEDIARAPTAEIGAKVRELMERSLAAGERAG